MVDVKYNGEVRTHNTGLAKVAVQCSADTFMVIQTLVLSINFSGENRHPRLARNRCRQPIDTSKQLNRITQQEQITAWKIDK